MDADINDSGGPAGFIYGFLFVWAGTLATYASLGELASMLYTPKATTVGFGLRCWQGPQPQVDNTTGCQCLLHQARKNFLVT